jgi:hypothetical protein
VGLVENIEFEREHLIENLYTLFIEERFDFIAQSDYESFGSCFIFQKDRVVVVLACTNFNEDKAGTVELLTDKIILSYPGALGRVYIEDHMDHIHMNIIDSGIPVNFQGGMASFYPRLFPNLQDFCFENEIPLEYSSVSLSKHISYVDPFGICFFKFKYDIESEFKNS